MASIRKRPNGYQVVYRDPTRRQRVETFRTHADAKRRKAEVEDELHRGVYRDPNAGKAGFEEVWFAYLDMKRVELRPSTFRLYESIGSTYVAGTFGERTIGDIRPADVRAWIAGLASRRAQPQAATSRQPRRRSSAATSPAARSCRPTPR